MIAGTLIEASAFYAPMRRRSWYADDEARALQLSIDPLANLAQTQEQIGDRLPELTPMSNEELRAAWEATLNPLLAECRAWEGEGAGDPGAVAGAGDVPG